MTLTGPWRPAGEYLESAPVPGGWIFREVTGGSICFVPSPATPSPAVAVPTLMTAEQADAAGRA